MPELDAPPPPRAPPPSPPPPRPPSPWRCPFGANCPSQSLRPPLEWRDEARADGVSYTFDADDEHGGEGGGGGGGVRRVHCPCEHGLGWGTQRPRDVLIGAAGGRRGAKKGAVKGERLRDLPTEALRGSHGFDLDGHPELTDKGDGGISGHLADVHMMRYAR